jgi:hypothetical protein
MCRAGDQVTLKVANLCVGSIDFRGQPKGVVIYGCPRRLAFRRTDVAVAAFNGEGRSLAPALST